MAFPQRFLDELIARNDIADVVGHYVALSRKGSSLFGLCPFHNEKTPSFSVSPEKQIYYCFGCKKGGSVIHFIMEEENLNFPEAVQFLARRVNMPVPEEESGAENRMRRKILALNRDAARFYYEQLQGESGRQVAAYLDRRKISRPVAVRFGLGAAADAWSNLTDAMVQKGYTKSELLAAGLSVQGKGGNIYDKFRNRLIFPIIDERGDVVGFGGRVIAPDDNAAKYINTQETDVYRKRRILYGLNLAKKTKRDYLLLVEGNMDVVMLHQAGFDCAVASMGTALTPEQIRLLSRFTKSIVLCYDNDDAGHTATQKALSLLANAALSTRVLELPRRLQDGQYVKQDADDFIKAFGSTAFERLLAGSESGADFRLAQLAEKYDLEDDRSRIAYAAAASELVASFPNAVERDIYTVRAAEAAHISTEAMRIEVGRAYKRLSRRDKRDTERRELNPAATMQPQSRTLRYDNLRSAIAEEGLIALLLTDDSVFGEDMPLQEEQFSSPLLGKLFTVLWEKRRYGAVSIPALSGELSPEEISHLSTIAQKPVSAKNAGQALRDYIRIIESESQKHGQGTHADPLIAVTEKYKRTTNDKGGHHES